MYKSQINQSLATRKLLALLSIGGRASNVCGGLALNIKPTLVADYCGSICKGCSGSGFWLLNSQLQLPRGCLFLFLFLIPIPI